MSKKELQQEIDVLNKELRPITGAVILAEAKLKKAKAEQDRIMSNRPHLLAEIALGENPERDLAGMREALEKTRLGIEDLPLMVDGLKEMQTDIAFNINNLRRNIRDIEVAEKEARDIEEFRQFHQEHFQGDWNKLQAESPWGKAEFDRLRNLWSCKYE